MAGLKQKSAWKDALFSGPREIRTLDLLNAIEARSQLRYGPIYQTNCVFCPSALRATAGHQVDLEGFEPSTSSVRLRRAPKLRYRPIFQGDDDFT